LNIHNSKIAQPIDAFCYPQMADAKNIIKVILLNAGKDSEIRIEAEGEDENEVLEDLTRLVESDFTRINEKVTI